MSTQSVSLIKGRLEAIVLNEPGTLRAFVAREALSYDLDDGSQLKKLHGRWQMKLASITDRQKE